MTISSENYFNLAVMNNKNNNPSIAIIAQPKNFGTWDVSVQPYGDQSFRQDPEAHKKVRCFLNFLQSSGFSLSPSKKDGQPYPYEQHVDSIDEVLNTYSEISTFLKDNKMHCPLN